MRKTWTETTAKTWISKVNAGKEKFGLTFCSACDYLKVSVSNSREVKGRK